MSKVKPYRQGAAFEQKLLEDSRAVVIVTE
jgi:hypothetical protein